MFDTDQYLPRERKLSRREKALYVLGSIVILAGELAVAWVLFDFLD